MRGEMIKPRRYNVGSFCIRVCQALLLRLSHDSSHLRPSTLTLAEAEKCS